MASTSPRDAEILEAMAKQAIEALDDEYGKG
jgi:hypothetical protein